MLAGYPKNVGNVFNYQVTGLTTNTTYYYTAAPQGNDAAASGKIEVKTSIPTEFQEDVDIAEIIAYFAEKRSV